MFRAVCDFFIHLKQRRVGFIFFSAPMPCQQLVLFSQSFNEEPQQCQEK